MRVLIADDDRIVTLMVSRVLTNWGHDPIVTYDGQAAWERVVADPAPSLAILDWEMPGLDGLALCRKIRGEPSRAHLYVLILTSRSSRADLVAGLDAGADDYLIKPFDPDELRARVQVGVRVVGLQERLAEQVRELQATLASVRQLRGLLPICSYCKRIRNDGNYWEQVDAYISANSDAKFSHGICPTCLEGVRATGFETPESITRKV